MKKVSALCCALLLAGVTSGRAADFTEFKTITRLTPSSARQVFFLDIEDLLKSPLVQKYAQKQITSTLTTNKESKKFFNAIGVDPIKTLEGVRSLYLTNDDATGKNFSLVLSGKFDDKKIKEAAKGLRDPEVKDLAVYKLPNGDSAIWALLREDHTLAISNKKSNVTAAASDQNRIHVGDEKDFLYDLVQSIYGKKAGRFRDTFGYFRKQTMWWAGDVTEDMREKFKNDKMVGKFAQQIHAFIGCVHIGSEIKGEVRILTSNQAAASQLKTVANAAKGLLQFAVASDKKLADIVNKVLEKVLINQKGITLNISFTITDTMVEDIVNLMP